MPPIDNAILNDILINKEFESGYLIRFTERHGGPVWYDLVKFRFLFYPDNQISIVTDNSVAKKMTEHAPDYTVYEGSYTVTWSNHDLTYGQIRAGDHEFNFETVPGNNHLLFIEQPGIWHESLVLQRVGKK
ncbi:MAG: hypothetical protein ABW019_03525 [Chitinophagaceae bacterium]